MPSRGWDSRANHVELICAGQGEICALDCHCWNSLHEADAKVSVGQASADVGLRAKRDIEVHEVLVVFGESITLRVKVAVEAQALTTKYNASCTIGEGFQCSIIRKPASDTDSVTRSSRLCHYCQIFRMIPYLHAAEIQKEEAPRHLAKEKVTLARFFNCQCCKCAGSCQVLAIEFFIIQS